MNHFPMLELTDDLYCVLDEQYCILSVNSRWTEILGYSLSDTVGKSFGHFCHFRTFQDQITETILKSNLQNKSGRLPDLKFVTIDGVVEHFRWKFKKVNEQYHMLGHQITDEIKYKEVLEVIETQLKVGYWRLNLTEMKPWWSDQTCLIHELPIGTTPSIKDALHYYPPEAIEAIQAAIDLCIQEGKRYDLELPFVTAKGRSLWVRTTGQALFDHGRAVELFGIFEDITERKNLEIKNRTHIENSYQNERLASLGELAAGVGHEINNPLTIAMGNVDFIKRHLMANNQFVPELAKNFERFERASTRISKIITSLRSLARESRNTEFETIDLNQLIRESLTIVTEILNKQHGIKINYDLSPSLAPVYIVQSRICHVLTNLLSNAKDAIDSQHEKEITVKTEVKDTFVVISISDNGTGIPEPLRTKVFDPFFTTKGPNRGIGIGLTVSANIINEHGGRLYINPNSNSTQFCIEIPIAEKMQIPITA